MNNETRERLQALGHDPDDLRGADFGGADFRWADFSEAELNGADLSLANLRGANLRGTDFSGARLIGADFREAILSGADFSGAVLSRATGNGREVQSMLVADHHVSWWADGGETFVAIGCQSHSLSIWKTHGESIAENHGRLSQWQTLGPALLQLIEASPPPTTTGNTQ